MKKISTFITEIQRDFEGGAGLELDWLGIIRDAVRTVNTKITPKGSKRTHDMYGGLTSRYETFYIPQDCNAPARIFSKDGTLALDYVPPAEYYSRRDRSKYTIETIDLHKYIVIRNETGSSSFELERFENTTDKTGVLLKPNTFKLFPGALITMQGVFTDTIYNISRAYTVPVRLSDYLYGCAVFPVFIQNEAYIESVDLTFTSVAGSIKISGATVTKTNIKNGINFLMFEMQVGVINGTFDSTNVTGFVLEIKQKTGASQTIVLGKASMQKNSAYYFEYYSRYAFYNEITGVWSDSPVTDDLIVYDDSVLDLLKAECKLLVFNGTTRDKFIPKLKISVMQEIAQAYAIYERYNVSDREYITYNIGLRTPRALGGGLREGQEYPLSSNDVQVGVPSARFADNEQVQGALNDSNNSFTIAFVPNPASSLLLFLGGLQQEIGVHFTLSGQTITYLSGPPSSTYDPLTHRVWYRY